MLRIAPFRAIRPVPNLAARIASVPYDVVNSAEARALAASNDLSFLHVVRPEIDLPADTDPYDDAVYEQGRTNLEQLLRRGAMIADATPRMFVYRQVMRHKRQIGLVCCCHVDDYAEDRIKKHERTRRAKEDDRTRHVLTLNANTGPVFLTYRDRAAIDALIARDMNSRPLYHFNATDGVTHSVWAAQDPSAYVDAFGDVPCAYVADGHHRAASAARAGAERRTGNPDHRGDEPYNWFLTALFPADQLQILPYHRVVLDAGDHTPASILAALAEIGTLEPTDVPQPDRAGVFCLYLNGGWHRLTLDPATIDDTDPVRGLDCALFQDRVLSPLFGIEDPRTDPRLDFVGGVRGTDELVRRVDENGAALAAALHPTSMEQLLAVADAGLVMPPKSTWFEPKLRSGLFVNPIGPVAGADESAKTEGMGVTS